MNNPHPPDVRLLLTDSPKTAIPLRQPKLARLMGPVTRRLLEASHQALNAMGFRAPLGPTAGIVVGLSTWEWGDKDLLESQTRHPDQPAFTAWQQEIPPLWMLHWLPNTPAAHLAIQFQATGPVHTMSSAPDALWNQTLELAEEWLQTGEASIVLAAARMPTEVWVKCCVLP